MAKGLRIREIPIETRYFDEASQIAFGPSVRYGLAILKTMLLYKLHVWGIYSSRIFRDRSGSRVEGRELRVDGNSQTPLSSDLAWTPTRP